MSAQKVFVYGTLKPGGFYYAQYCEGRVIEQREAIVQGHLFDLPIGYPAMTQGKGWVYGFLLTFANPDILQALDELEDFKPDRSAVENEYQRCEVEVFGLQQQPLGCAWTYRMQGDRVQAMQGIWLRDGKWIDGRRPGIAHR